MKNQPLRRLVPLALVMVMLLGVLRGGATSISKYITINDVPPIGYALWQSAIAMVLMFLMGYLRTRRRPDFSGQYILVLVCGLVGTAIPNVVFFMAVRHLPAGTMAVLLTLVPIMTYLMVVSIGQERPDITRILGIGCGLSGALMIALPKVSDGVIFDSWVLIALLCPLGYALMGVYTAARAPAHIHPFYLVAGTHLVSMMFLIVAAQLSGQFYPLWESLRLSNLLIVGHGVLAATAYALFFIIVRLAGAVYYSLSHYIVALTGLGWGWLVFGESHTSWFWLAVVCILVGLTIVNARQKVVTAA